MKSPATGLEYEIKLSPNFSLLEVNLQQEETIRAESGAMMWMDQSVQMVTQKGGKGIMKSLKRKIAGESFFVNTFHGPGRAGFAPVYEGDLWYIPLQPNDLWICSGGCYLASTPPPAVETDSKFQGMKGLFSRENLFMLKVEASEPADLFVSAFGSFQEFNLKPNERLTLDTGNLVCMEGSVQYNVKRVGGLKSSLMSGEGLVLDVIGPGKVIAQTRTPDQFFGWLKGMLPSRQGKKRSIGGGFLESILG